MSPTTIGIIGIVLMLVLMFVRMPIGPAMAAVGFIGFIYIADLHEALAMFAITAYRTGTLYILTVIPLFILMGCLAADAGVGGDGFYAANKWLGHLPGGLSMAAVGGCTAFAAVCGDHYATAATMCKVALPEMRRYKYADQLSLGAIGSGGQLGFMIPPSNAFIIYAFLTDVSIGSLFIAGILPGLLIAFLFLVSIYIVCRLNPSLGPAGPRASWRERFGSLYRVWGVIVLFVLVLGGIYAGIFVPTEAGAVGAFGALVLGLAKRKMSWRGFKASLVDTARLTGMILLLIFGAAVFSYFVAATELPFALARFVSGLAVPPIMIMSAMLVVYIIVGFFMSVLSVMMITLPIFYPILLALGIDPIWFGVLCVLTVMLGNTTPPFATVVFALSGLVRDVSISTIFRGVWPFVYAMLIALIILVAFPQISLLLPNLMIVRA